MEMCFAGDGGMRRAVEPRACRECVMEATYEYGYCEGASRGT
jgi:hypothetical protein